MAIQTPEQQIECLRRENAALAAERDQLLALCTQAPALICMMQGPDHVFMFANPIYRQVLGNRDLIGRTIREVLPEVEGQGYFELLDEVYRTGEPFFGNEMPVLFDRRGDGALEQAYFNFVYAAMRDHEGQVVGILVHAVEVTAMVAAREQVQRSEDRFRSLVKATSQLVWMTDAQGRVDDIPEWRAYTGQPPEAVHGYGWVDALHPDDRARAEAAWKSAVASLTPYEVEYRIRRHDGIYESFIARGTPVLEPDGSVREWVGLCHNVEDQRRMEAEYRRLVETSPDVICTIGADGFIKRTNPAFGRILGHADRVLLGAPYLDFVHPDDRAATMAEAQKLAEGGATLHFENRYLAADGSVRWINWTCTSDKDAALFYCIGRDVTEARAAAEALWERELRYELVARATNDVIWDWDLTTDRVTWNDGVHRVFGYEPGQVEQTAGWWYDHIHPEDQTRVVDGIHAAQDRGEPAWTDEYRYRRADGSYAWVTDRGYCVFDADGKPIRMVGAMHDRTAERQARLDRDRHFEVSIDIVGVATPDGRFLQVNPAVERVLGYTPAEFCAVPFLDFIHPEDLQPTLDKLASLAVGEPLVSWPNRYRAQDGSYRHIAWSTVPVVEEGLLYTVGRDVTDLVEVATQLQEANQGLAAQAEELQAQQEELQMQTEELQSQQEALRVANEELVTLSAQAQAANKMKSEFLANMSHELRTPLNSIIGYTELVLLLAGGGLGQTEQDNLNVVLRNARHLLSLINDVLDLSKIEAGKATVRPEPFEPAGVVEAVLGTAEPMAREKGLRLAAHMASGLGPVVSDELKVRQILLNLVSNAIKFTKEGGVDIHLEPRGETHWALRVVDTGIGIAPAHHGVVFEEFRQVDASSTRQAGGTGLGLSIARGLTRLLGGQMTLESELGQGSTFTVVLPREFRGGPLAQGAGADTLAAEAPAGLEGGR